MTSQIHSCLLTFGGSFFLSLILTPVVRKVAIASGQVAVPKDNRWHKKPTALLGGVIYVGYAGGCARHGTYLRSHLLLRLKRPSLRGAAEIFTSPEIM